MLEYTQTFARDHLAAGFRKTFTVPKVWFNYDTESWGSASFELPSLGGDYVLLTPKDILTRDETWINKTDFIDQFERIPDAIPNSALRAQIDNYFKKQLPRHPTKKDEAHAAVQTMLQYPEVIDYFIRYKEDHGDQAVSISAKKVSFSEYLYLQQFKSLPDLLRRETAFYELSGTTYEETMKRVLFFKGLTIAQHNPAAEIYALDWKNVLAVAHENAVKFGVADRWHPIEGSAFTADYGSGYDVVLVTNFIHHFDVATNIGLFEKIHAAMKPGSKMAILEMAVNDDRITPPGAGLFAMTMLTTTASGDAFSLREIESMCIRAGFHGVTHHAVPSTPQTVTVAVN